MNLSVVLPAHHHRSPWTGPGAARAGAIITAGILPDRPRTLAPSHPRTLAPYLQYVSIIRGTWTLSMHGPEPSLISLISDIMSLSEWHDACVRPAVGVIIAISTYSSAKYS